MVFSREEGRDLIPNTPALRGLAGDRLGEAEEGTAVVELIVPRVNDLRSLVLTGVGGRYGGGLSEPPTAFV